MIAKAAIIPNAIAFLIDYAILFIGIPLLGFEVPQLCNTHSSIRGGGETETNTLDKLYEYFSVVFAFL